MTATTRPLALITGASSGIGFELAKLFATDGYDLIINSDDSGKLGSAASRLRAAASDAQVDTIVADLSKPDGASTLYEAVLASGRTVDVVVNNAGVGVYGDFSRETDLEKELAMIQLNVVACVQLTKRYAREMVQRGSGKILITASVASLMPTPLQTLYGATKAFLYAFSQGLREELRETGVSVTALMPGATDTNFFKRAGMEDSKIAQGNLADPAEVAAAGYKALMKGEDKVVTPFKYRVETAVVNVIPDETVAKIAHKQHERA